jgi:IclR family KDG regulon transcriptional repressor
MPPEQNSWVERHVILMTKTQLGTKIGTANVPKSNPYLSIEKALRMLEILALHSPRGVTEIADKLGLKKSSVSRLLKALAELGYAEQSAQRGQYRMSPKVLMLAQCYLKDDPLVTAAQPIIHELALAVRASAHAAVLVGRDVVIVANEPSPERIQVTTRVGGGTPLHASALGRVLMADLPEKERLSLLSGPLARFTDKTITDPRKLEQALDQVREQGYAIELEEEHPGVGSVGAPVLDASGRWVAAVSITGPLHGTPFKIDAKHRQLVVNKAAELTRLMTRT